MATTAKTGIDAESYCLMAGEEICTSSSYGEFSNKGTTIEANIPMATTKKTNNDVDSCCLTAREEETSMSSSSTTLGSEDSSQDRNDNPNDDSFSGPAPYCIFVATTTETSDGHGNNICRTDSSTTTTTEEEDDDDSDDEDEYAVREPPGASASASDGRRFASLVTPLQVSFDERLNVYHEYPNSFDIHPREVWYSPQEYRDFRLFSTKLAGAFVRMALPWRNQKTTRNDRNTARLFMTLLNKSYTACCGNLDSDSNTPNIENENEEDSDDVDELAFKKVCNLLTVQEHCALNKIYLTTEELHGLEKMIVRSISRDIQGRRKELKLTVEEIQGGMNVRKTWPSNRYEEEDGFMALEMRKSCEIVSQPSALFAQYLAQFRVCTFAC